MSKRTRVAGIVAFALGIVVLIFVFAIAYSMFTSPAEELLSPKGGQNSSLTAVGLGNILVMLLVRILLLLVMTLAGSLIASRGIQLYLGASRGTASGGGRTPDA